MNTYEEKLDRIVAISHDLQDHLELNTFSLLSAGVFQLENFHSKVLSELLNPRQRHGRAEILMQGLFELLAGKAAADGKAALAERIRRAWKNGFYEGVKVNTEYSVFSEGHCGRIDILLRNEDTKQVVIIENKINGAPDMSRQLLRYMKALSAYEIVAVVYLKPFDDAGHPDWGNWSNGERAMVDEALVPIAACNGSALYTLEKWLKEAGREDGQIDQFANQYVRFVGGQVADQERWDKLCSSASGIAPMAETLLTDKVAKQMLGLLPEYIERRVLYACPQCEFQKSIYDDRYDCASFQGYFVGATQCAGKDAPELGLDVTDRAIRFFVREDKSRLVSREAFSRLSGLMERIDSGFKEMPRGRLNQYVINVDDAYDDVGEYVKRVAHIIAVLSDKKDGISKVLLKS